MNDPLRPDRAPPALKKRDPFLEQVDAAIASSIAQRVYLDMQKTWLEKMEPKPADEDIEEQSPPPEQQRVLPDEAARLMKKEVYDRSLLRCRIDLRDEFRQQAIMDPALTFTEWFSDSFMPRNLTNNGLYNVVTYQCNLFFKQSQVNPKLKDSMKAPEMPNDLGGIDNAVGVPLARTMSGTNSDTLVRTFEEKFLVPVRQPGIPYAPAIADPGDKASMDKLAEVWTADKDFLSEFRGEGNTIMAPWWVQYLSSTPPFGKTRDGNIIATGPCYFCSKPTSQRFTRLQPIDPRHLSEPHDLRIEENSLLICLPNGSSDCASRGKGEMDRLLAGLAAEGATLPVVASRGSVCWNKGCPKHFRTVRNRNAAEKDQESKQVEEKVKMMRCSTCKVARYCSAECQRAHWSVHKQMHEKIKAMGGV